MKIFWIMVMGPLFFWSLSSESHREFLENRLVDRISQEMGVPGTLLKAIACCESGVGKKKTPWMWTLNWGGRAFYCKSHPAMKLKLIALLNSGKINIDIGPLQINWKWHGKKFDSIEQAVDPYQNMLLAARFLKELHKEFGSWGKAVGAYHSRNKEKSKVYTALIVKQFKRMGLRAA